MITTFVTQSTSIEVACSAISASTDIGDNHWVRILAFVLWTALLGLIVVSIVL